MYVAVVGCSHGEVDKIYEVVEHIEKQRNIKVDLLLCCGDFQSVRNMTDLRSMACPIKYQAMHDFHRYYSGEKKASVLTLFIGGNHEASNFLQELPYGGWVAPNMFYCGYTTVLNYGPLRIATISGIYKGHDFLKGRHEKPPYNQNTIRSVYHYRNLEIFRLKQIQNHVDIVISHDWPKGVHNYGDVDNLLRKKPFFRQEIQQNELGSRPLFEVLSKLKPSYWFSAHLHVKFAAIIPHDCVKNSNNSSITETANENSEAAANETVETQEKSTRFLALDKVLPHRPFLQIIDIPNKNPTEELKLCYDAEWLAILKSTDNLVSVKDTICYMPSHTGLGRFDYSPSLEEIEKINDIFGGNFDVPQNFSRTSAIHVEGDRPGRATPVMNPQTTEFCAKLEIVDPLRLALASDDSNRERDYDVMDVMGASSYADQSQLDITYNETTCSQPSINPDEITFDDDDDDTSAEQGKSISIAKLVESSTRNKLVLPTPKFESEPCGDDASSSVSTKPVSPDNVKYFVDTVGEGGSFDTKGDIHMEEGSKAAKRKSEIEEEDDELAALLELQNAIRQNRSESSDEPKCKERKSLQDDIGDL